MVFTLGLHVYSVDKLQLPCYDVCCTIFKSLNTSIYKGPRIKLLTTKLFLTQKLCRGSGLRIWDPSLRGL